MDARVLKRVLITDRRLCEPALLAAVVSRAAAKAGVTMVVVRELDLPPDEQIRVARDIIASTRVPVVMARNPELALRAGCAGVQLGWGSPDVLTARALLGPDAMIGVSVHSVDEGLRVRGADYLVLGPIAATPKVRGPVTPLGFEPLRRLARGTATPVVAIGGLSGADEAAARAAGAAGVAAIRAFMAAGS